MTISALRHAASGLSRGLALSAALMGSVAAQVDEPAAAPFSHTEVTADLAPRLADTQLSRVEAVRWRQSGAHAVGLGFGMATETVALHDGRSTVVRPSVGLRWRSNIGETQRIDVATWRTLRAPRDSGDALIEAADPTPVTTRIEMQFSPQKSRGFGPELGAIGMQMSSNAKLQLKIRKGGPMVYYRSKF